MKKILLILFVGILIFSFVGCGNKDVENGFTELYRENNPNADPIILILRDNETGIKYLYLNGIWSVMEKPSENLES